MSWVLYVYIHCGINYYQSRVAEVFSMHTGRALHARRACNCVVHSTESIHFRQHLHNHANGPDHHKVCTTSDIYICIYIYIYIYIIGLY